LFDLDLPASDNIRVALGLSSRLSLYCPAKREVVFAYSTKRFRNFSRTFCSLCSTFIHNEKRKERNCEVASLKCRSRGNVCSSYSLRSAEQTQRSILTDTNSPLQIRRALNLHGETINAWIEGSRGTTIGWDGNVSKEISPIFPEIESILWK